MGVAVFLRGWRAAGGHPARSGRYAARAAAALAGAALCSCYTFSGSTLPAHLRTVQIDPVANQTLESALADRITTAVSDGFRQRGNLRPVNQGGDAEFIGVLTQYSHKPQATSGDKVLSFRVDMVMKVRFIDHVKGDTLYKEDNLPGFGLYYVDRGETEETGRKAAIDNLVKVILDNTVSGW